MESQQNKQQEYPDLTQRDSIYGCPRSSSRDGSDERGGLHRRDLRGADSVDGHAGGIRGTGGSMGGTTALYDELFCSGGAVNKREDDSNQRNWCRGFNNTGGSMSEWNNHSNPSNNTYNELLQFNEYFDTAATSNDLWNEQQQQQQQQQQFLNSSCTGLESGIYDSQWMVGPHDLALQLERESRNFSGGSTTTVYSSGTTSSVLPPRAETNSTPAGSINECVHNWSDRNGMPDGSDSALHLVGSDRRRDSTGGFLFDSLNSQSCTAPPSTCDSSSTMPIFTTADLQMVNQNALSTRISSAETLKEIIPEKPKATSPTRKRPASTSPDLPIALRKSQRIKPLSFHFRTWYRYCQHMKSLVTARYSIFKQCPLMVEGGEPFQPKALNWVDIKHRLNESTGIGSFFSFAALERFMTSNYVPEPNPPTLASKTEIKKAVCCKLRHPTTRICHKSSKFDKCGKMIINPDSVYVLPQLQQRSGQIAQIEFWTVILGLKFYRSCEVGGRKDDNNWRLYSRLKRTAIPYKNNAADDVDFHFGTDITHDYLGLLKTLCDTTYLDTKLKMVSNGFVGNAEFDTKSLFDSDFFRYLMFLDSAGSSLYPDAKFAGLDDDSFDHLAHFQKIPNDIKKNATVNGPLGRHFGEFNEWNQRTKKFICAMNRLFLYRDEYKFTNVAALILIRKFLAEWAEDERYKYQDAFQMCWDERVLQNTKHIGTAETLRHKETRNRYRCAQSNARSFVNSGFDKTIHTMISRCLALYCELVLNGSFGDCVENRISAFMKEKHLLEYYENRAAKFKETVKQSGYYSAGQFIMYSKKKGPRNPIPVYDNVEENDSVGIKITTGEKSSLISKKQAGKTDEHSVNASDNNCTDGVAAGNADQPPKADQQVSKSDDETHRREDSTVLSQSNGKTRAPADCDSITGDLIDYLLSN
ncbi:Oidioi.mRNA.OKI2018_I69.PAR.g11537.t1.cds [Oikopleura dioica]|uniref:Oidioi.mRNA.OKI2018_I69.PAR.g11537.t1.cds n=1 Tax=Oikopleura dioica TaxID=34765 RepID=A0ABN7RWI8_OIKDI|nr:Oidioi.mRNA.OKI2018_I69.PAR.g11537.t1.cds [Oikopleura dioica]